MQLRTLLSSLWKNLYPEENMELLEQFIDQVKKTKQEIHFQDHEAGWYKDAVIYSLYVDLFNSDFTGLKNKLNYLQNLGINCLWLLPILDSPMKDAGFDIKDYKRIRTELLGSPKTSNVAKQQKIFNEFIWEAHSRGIKVIFDIAINHTSNQHYWFQESLKSEDNPYYDYYLWSENTERYKEARIIFYGLCDSNWEKSGDKYFFHRFFEFQPDLNYKNPKVLLEMMDNFLFWLSMGVDGFRADAIPYVWKEEGTNCENLPQTHLIVKFFRAVFEFVRPGTLLLAEACQKPKEVVKYFGNGDECNGAYHFPLMPQIFKAIAAQNGNPIRNTLTVDVTPDIPTSAQWFTFLRCHDELSLELVYVTNEDRKYLHEHYCIKPEWDFRLGQGISSRLSELMQCNVDKIALAFSIMLSLPGTPIIYYGDEFGKLNDEDYYNQMIKHTGKDDTRFLVRGKINWEQTEIELSNKESFSAQVYGKIKRMINTRNMFKCFGRGDIEWINFKDKDGKKLDRVLAYKRSFQDESVLVLQNLSAKTLSIDVSEIDPVIWTELLGQRIIIENKTRMTIKPFGVFWVAL